MSPKHYYTDFRSPIGTLHLRGTDDGVSGLFTEGHAYRPALPGSAIRDDSPLRPALEQLEEFFSGRRQTFSVPLVLGGTAFQSRVWRELLTIPYGTTTSYANIAARIGAPRAFRAIGAANRNNPISILVPCHRVIAANGGLGGYASGLERKQFLLNLERTYTLRAGTSGT